MPVETGPGRLRLEVAGREMTGPLVPGGPPRRMHRYLLGLPASLLTAVLVLPVLWTTWWAFRTDDGLGFGNFAAVLGDGEARRAIGNSVLWVLVALGLATVGLAIALLGRRVGRLWSAMLYVLVLPFGVATLVAGAAFRIVFDPAPERGTASALAEALLGRTPVWLGPGLIWWVLVSAFAWAWLGFVVSLFRAGLESIPVDLIRTVRAEGVGLWRRLRTLELPLLRPVTAVVVLTLVVAAVRLFDLVLVAVPGPLQDEVSVVPVHWWRATARSADPGQPAALAVLLFVAVAVVALVTMRGLRRRWAVPAGPQPGDAPADAADSDESGAYDSASDDPGRAESRWPIRLVGLVVAVLWAFPVLVLVATAFHVPSSAGADGWWHLDGLGVQSFAEVANAGLWRSLSGTLLLAVLATGIVIFAAVPAAYLLAWGRLPRWLTRALIVVLSVLAVTPVQMYAGPLGDAVGSLGLGGTRSPLVLVHAAAGLPFAVLLLRPAFTSAPPGPAADALFGQRGQRALLDRVWHRFRPALVAVAVLEFVLVWNDFIIGFLISGPGSTPFTLVLWGEARQFATSAGTVAAGAVVASVVPVAVLLLTWRSVVRGLTGGVLR